MNPCACMNPAEWALLNLGGARLRDRRRTRRAVTIACAMAEHPGWRIPQLFSRRSACKAAYEFFDREEASPDRLQAGHRDSTLRACREPGVVLLVEDTSTMSFTGRSAIAGLGPVGDETTETQQGFLLHSVLALRWHRPAGLASSWAGREAVELVGLADQQYRVRRAGTRRGRTGEKGSRRSGAEDLESSLWETSTERIGRAPLGVRWVRVCDREADIYEVLASYRASGHGFVVRARSDRATLDPETGRDGGLLFARSRAAPSLGSFELELRARPGQKARRAVLRVSAVALSSRSPDRPCHRRGTLAPLSFTVVRVFEPKAPAGVDALEWFLLTDAAVASFADALEVSLEYSARWLIEEYHKGLKTGMGAEDLQLETASRLMAAVALMAVTALRLLDLKERARLKAAAPATDSGLNEDELLVLALATGRRLTTVGDVMLALGHLGGHLNRKGDGMPGWQTLWRGWNQLQSLLTGFRLAKKVYQSRE